MSHCGWRCVFVLLVVCMCVQADGDREMLINTGFVSCRVSDIELPSAPSVLCSSTLPRSAEQMRAAEPNTVGCFFSSIMSINSQSISNQLSLTANDK